MAYLREYLQQCFTGGCNKPARVELLNRFNASCGFYCAPHGRAAEKRLQQAEDDAHRRERAADLPVRAVFPLADEDQR